MKKDVKRLLKRKPKADLHTEIESISILMQMLQFKAIDECVNGKQGNAKHLLWMKDFPCKELQAKAHFPTNTTNKSKFSRRAATKAIPERE